MTRKKVLIGGGALLVVAALVGANFYFKRTPGKAVNVEALKQRDLEATVSASGKIQARTTVNISSDTVGRVTQLSVAREVHQHALRLAALRDHHRPPALVDGAKQLGGLRLHVGHGPHVVLDPHFSPSGAKRGTTDGTTASVPWRLAASFW